MLGLFDGRLAVLLGGSPDCGAVGIRSGLVCAAVGCRFAVVVAAAAAVDCGGEAEGGGAGEVVGGHVGGKRGLCCVAVRSFGVSSFRDEGVSVVVLRVGDCQMLLELY